MHLRNPPKKGMGLYYVVYVFNMRYTPTMLCLEPLRFSLVHYQYWQWCIPTYRLNYSSMKLHNIIMLSRIIVRERNIHRKNLGSSWDSNLGPSGCSYSWATGTHGRGAEARPHIYIAALTRGLGFESQLDPRFFLWIFLSLTIILAYLPAFHKFKIIMLCVTMVKPLKIMCMLYPIACIYKCACTLAWIW